MTDSPREGSHFAYDCIVQRNVSIPARDGVSLATDIYRPALNGQPLPGPFPVLLERTPYLKSEVRYHRKFSMYARLGYLCACQDVRGRGESGGEWYPFAEEAQDGYDSVEWLAAQPWCSGKVGTIGTSYGGSLQSALATLNPPHLAAQFISMGASNYFDCSMRHNGCLEQRFLIYAFRMAVTSQQAQASPAVHRALVHAFEHIGETLNRLPLRKGETALSLVPNIEQWALDIQNRAEYDDYWRKRGLGISEYWQAQADVPTVFFGGWYDSYARATTTNFMKLSRIKESPMYLVMGPWTHGDPTCEQPFAGEVNFGCESALDEYHRIPLRFFDTWLKDMNTGLHDEARAQLFVMGPHSEGPLNHGHRDDNGRLVHGGRWEEADSWPIPEAAPTPYYLHAEGLLSTEPPACQPDEPGSISTLQFDPKNPVPTIGGCNSAGNPLLQPGAYDQRGRPFQGRGLRTGQTFDLFPEEKFFGSDDTLPLAARNDVLVFQTPPLEHAVELTGPILVRIWLSTSAVDTDLSVKLVDVFPPSDDYPAGFDMLVTDSIQRGRFRRRRSRGELMIPGKAYRFRFELYPTANVFAAGHRIRIDISASNWPRFDVNPGTGEPLGQHRTTVVARNTIHHHAERPSHVVLPVVTRG